jgi:hypothetical protein
LILADLIDANVSGGGGCFNSIMCIQRIKLLWNIKTATIEKISRFVKRMAILHVILFVLTLIVLLLKKYDVIDFGRNKIGALKIVSLLSILTACNFDPNVTKP